MTIIIILKIFIKYINNNQIYEQLLIYIKFLKILKSNNIIK